MAESGKRLLLVDDSELVVTMLSDHLETEGYEILTAPDGAAGWARVGADKPDLIITDVQMPKMSGLDFTRKVRAGEATRHIPIIMITTLNTMDDRIAGIEAGADDFINKPFNKQILLLKIRNLLKSGLLTKQLAQNVQAMKAANEELEKLRRRAKDWIEVAGEELKGLAANLSSTLNKLTGEMANSGANESTSKLARWSADYAQSLSDKLNKVFHEGREG